MLEISDAVVVVPASAAGVEQQAFRMLVEEVEKRTALRWQTRSSLPENNTPAVLVGTVAELKQSIASKPWPDNQRLEPTEQREGYQIRTLTQERQTTVLVAGEDLRGVLFGVGRLLRELRMGKGKVQVRNDLNLASAPRYPLRGHQLGYRPKTNSYDAWDLATWEQYLRDLIVFGCNTIELIPPRSDDATDSPHFPRPPLEMMIEMSRLADRYGLDVWIWYPAMDRDYSQAATVQSALKEWGDLFARLPRVDAVFVPGGDPGHTPPRYLMALLEQQSRNLRRFHPKAGLWVSPQGFNQSWMEEFLAIVNTEQPAWLSGVVFGPQVRMDLPELRQRLPASYPIRLYPDITHSRQCQYPVPDWDLAYAVTEARECINPRPQDQAAIFRATSPNTIGFITYSEGCNDDVNKAVWSALGWNPEAKPVDILREYSRYFIAEALSDDFAQGLLALERNWRGALIANPSVETTLRQFQAMERTAPPERLKNWRFQQALFRAYYDAYVHLRLLHETELEKSAMDKLRDAAQPDSRRTIAAAEGILERAQSDRVAPDLRERILELGAALFQSVGMQLSVAKYQAIAVDRGAALDTLEFPLNNRLWLRQQFQRVRRLKTEPERLMALRRIVEWDNPGPGGFYDDLGNPARQPHLVRRASYEQDPGALHSPRNDFEEDLVVDEDDPAPDGPRRLSWIDHAETLYDTPLQLHYDGLDPAAAYQVRVVYAGDSPKRRIRLTANDGLDVHPFLTKPLPFGPLTFEIPPAATTGGSLTLTWSAEPGLGGNGRACQVSEVWLMKHSR